jgi:hypothetical protein
MDINELTIGQAKNQLQKFQLRLESRIFLELSPISKLVELRLSMVALLPWKRLVGLRIQEDTIIAYQMAFLRRWSHTQKPQQ